MTKRFFINILAVIIGLIALVSGTYMVIKFFSPPIMNVPEQDPSAGVLPKAVIE